MKKRFTVLVALGLGLALGRMFDGAGSTAVAGGGYGGGGEQCAAQNGDVNADGGVDVSDAITILGYLFIGNPTELLPLCKTQTHSGLPDTGESKCYGGYVVNQGWAEVPCDQAACKGQDGAYATGCPSEGRFTDNGDGTVSDNCTGLMWQKDTADVDGDGQLNQTADDASWCDALAYCERLSFAGHDDWRLPNVRELHSIVDYGRKHWTPSIDPVFGAWRARYWSSTSFAARPPGGAIVVDFGDGGGLVDVDELRTGPYSVRAVRTLP